jgi:O-antigen ligase
MKKLLFLLIYLFSVLLAIGPGILAERSTSHIQIVIFIIDCIGLGLIANKKRRKIKSYRKYIYSLFTFFVIICISIVINAYFTGITEYQFIVKYFSFVIFFILYLIFFGENKMLVYKSMFIYGATCFCIAVLWMAGFMNNYMELAWGRLSVVGETANGLGDRQALAFVLLLFFSLISNYSRKVKVLTLLMNIPIFITIVATGSRGGLLMIIIIGTILILFSQVKMLKKILIIMLLGIFVAFLINIFIVNNDEYAMSTRLLDTIETGNIAGRDILMKESINIFADNPFLGIGSEKLYLQISEHDYVHNYALHILAVYGGFAFLFLLIFYFICVRDLLKSFKYSTIPLFLFIYMFAITMKSTAIIQPYMWFVFAISLALSFNIEKKYESTLPDR